MTPDQTQMVTAWTACLLCCGLFVAGANGIVAADGDIAMEANRPCTASECRQFDFWIGDWEVRTPQGQLAGTNRIEKILGGCVLEENWTGASGVRGKSFNIFSAADRKWHQTWVDSNGLLLVLVGDWRDNKMELGGEVPQPDGKVVVHRVTWKPMADGGVRQHWETSEDGGKSWSDVFVGLYRRR